MERGLLLALVFIGAGLCVAGSFAGVAYGLFAANATSGANAATAWTSATMTATSTADFNAGLPLQVDTSGDQVTLPRAATGPYVYALRGGGQTAFWRYDVSANTWSVMSPAPAAIGAGGALAYAGGDFIYALRGGGTRDFYRYNIAANTWSSMTRTPSAVNAGGSLVFAGTYVYALRGGNNRNFWRYSASANSWTSLRNLPANANSGAALTYTGGNTIYGQRGGNNGAFYAYSISGNVWQNTPPAEPGNGYEPGDGAALASAGTRVYLHSGVDSNNDRNRFSIYTIATNQWTHYTTPYLAGAGGALASDGTAYLYALQGGASTGFWRFTPAANTWAALNGTPGIVGTGGSLACVPATGAGCYAGTGSIASVVYDTTRADSRWDMLAWTASVPAGTAIAVQVRSSNAPFTEDATSPGWTTVTGSPSGSEYMVAYPSLPSGRYHQWRANLSSTLCDAAPVLYDVTVYFSDGMTPLAGGGGGASMARTGSAKVSTFPEIPSGPAPADLPGPTPEPAPNATMNATPAPTTNATPTGTPMANETATPAAEARNATPPPTATKTPVPTTTGLRASTVTEDLVATLPPTANATPTATANARANATTIPTETGTATVATPPLDTPTVPPTPELTTEPRTLLDVAADDRNLTTFLDLVREAGLDRELEGPGPWTVFAPTDDAFGALPTGYLAGLRADPPLLAAVLSRHATDGDFEAADLAVLRTVRVLDGAEIGVEARDGRLTVGDATINYTACRAANGVVHAIDAVLLLPATPTPVEVPANETVAAPGLNATPTAEFEPVATVPLVTPSAATTPTPTAAPSGTTPGRHRPL